MALMMLNIRVMLVSSLDLVFNWCDFLVKAREERTSDLRNSLLIDELQSLVYSV